jgi:hypothetical protein
MSYQRLIAEHARIDAAMLHLQACADAVVPDCAAAARALADAATLLRDHITHEGACLYSELIVSGAHPFSQTAQEFAATLSVLQRDCVRYFTAWNAESLRADWSGFRRETLAIATRLAERGVAENALLYTPALRESVIPLRSLAA